MERRVIPVEVAVSGVRSLYRIARVLRGCSGTVYWGCGKQWGVGCKLLWLGLLGMFIVDERCHEARFWILSYLSSLSVVLTSTCANLWYRPARLPDLILN